MSSVLVLWIQFVECALALLGCQGILTSCRVCFCCWTWNFSAVFIEYMPVLMSFWVLT